MTQTIEIFQQEDGFWAGKKNKNGKMAKGSYHITGEDIMTMHTSLVKDLIAETGDKKVLMRDSDGNLFATVMIPVNEAGEAEG